MTYGDLGESAVPAESLSDEERHIYSLRYPNREGTIGVYLITLKAR